MASKIKNLNETCEFCTKIERKTQKHRSTSRSILHFHIVSKASGNKPLSCGCWQGLLRCESSQIYLSSDSATGQLNNRKDARFSVQPFGNFNCPSYYRQTYCPHFFDVVDISAINLWLWWRIGCCCQKVGSIRRPVRVKGN